MKTLASTTLIAAALVLIFGLAAAVSADEVLLNSGSEMDGKIEKVDQNGIALNTGSETIVIAPNELDPHYYYTQWAKRIDKDAEQHLRLAVYAFENGLFNQARSQYRKAEKLDKEMVQKFEREIVPKIKEGIADKLLAMAQAAAKRDDWKEAEKIAAKILTRLEDTQAAEKAREVLASAHTWELDADQARLLKRLQKYLPQQEAQALKERERLTKKLEPIQKHIESARKLVNKALHTKTSNRQKGIFEQAGKKFSKAVSDLDKVADAAGEDQALREYTDELRDVATREGVDAYIHAGNVLLIRSSFNDALNMANAALALDPDSDAAKAFLKEVTDASNRGGWWGRRR